MIDFAGQLGFTLEDLNANRAGDLSEAQRARLHRALLRDSLLYGAVALLPLGGFVLLLFSELDNQNVCGGPVTLGILALLTGAFVVYIVNLNRSTRADLSGRVGAISGRVGLRDVGRGLYRLNIGQMSFQVSAQVFSAFTNDRFYRIYYTPNLKTILSAEVAE